MLSLPLPHNEPSFIPPDKISGNEVIIFDNEVFVLTTPDFWYLSVLFLIVSGS